MSIPSYTAGVTDEEQQEERVDVRVPVTVQFDFFIDNIPKSEIRKAIERLEDAVISAALENLIADEFEGDLASGTRWTPAQADLGNAGIRDHAPSGSFRPVSAKEIQ